ncbi:MAG: 3-phosphoglycerate dehydrogenase, partial [Clostridia bacterium]|nr:3-phosphoglycerate dehydrogenase [Clostridia bacterium]
GFDPYLSVDHAWHISRGTQRAVKLEELLTESDFISIHIPQTKDTMNYLSTPEFSKMKPGVVIVNMARGGLVKDVSLFDAIDNGIVRKYITDFPSAQMIGRKGIVAIPHLGASTPESEENCAIMAAQEVRSYLETGTIQNSVNLPPCAVEPITQERLTVIHKNTPNMVGQITRVIAASSMNIADMVNKSRGEYAYTVLNLDHKLTPEVTDAIEAIPDVIKIRDL